MASAARRAGQGVTIIRGASVKTGTYNPVTGEATVTITKPSGDVELRTFEDRGMFEGQAQPIVSKAESQAMAAQTTEARRQDLAMGAAQRIASRYEVTPETFYSKQRAAAGLQTRTTEQNIPMSGARAERPVQFEPSARQKSLNSVFGGGGIAASMMSRQTPRQKEILYSPTPKRQAVIDLFAGRRSSLAPIVSQAPAPVTNFSLFGNRVSATNISILKPARNISKYNISNNKAESKFTQEYPQVSSSEYHKTKKDNLLYKTYSEVQKFANNFYEKVTDYGTGSFLNPITGKKQAGMSFLKEIQPLSMPTPEAGTRLAGTYGGRKTAPAIDIWANYSKRAAKNLYEKGMQAEKTGNLWKARGYGYASFAASLTEPETATKIGLTIAALPAATELALATPIVRPVASGILSKVAKHKIKTGLLIGAGFSLPAGVESSKAGYPAVGQGQVLAGATLGAIFPAAERQPFGYSKFEILQTTGKPVSVRSFGIETEGRGYPLISAVNKKVRFGIPDITKPLKGMSVLAEIKPGSAIETKLLQKNLFKVGETARAREGISLAQSLIRKTKGTQSKFISELPKMTERLSEKGTGVFYKIAKEERATIFGSTSRAAQTPKSFGIVPKDLDIRLPDASPFNIERVTGKAVRGLREIGIPARRSKDIFEAVETKHKGKWVKAAEFKGMGLPVEEEVPLKVVGFKKEGFPIKISGLPTTPLEEELRGVVQGVIRIRKQKGLLDIFPQEKRVKDIQSTILSAETLRRSQTPERVGLSKDIENFGKLFEPKGKSAARIRLADFSVSKSARKLPSLKFVSPVASYGKAKSAVSIFRSLSKSISSGKSVSPSVSPGSASISPSPSPYKSIIPKSLSPPSPPSSYRSLLPSLSPPSPSPYRSPSPSTSMGSIVSLPPVSGLPGLPAPFFPSGGRFGRAKWPKVKYGYTPTIEALALGIKGVKPSAREIATGLNIRPIVGKQKVFKIRKKKFRRKKKK